MDEQELGELQQELRELKQQIKEVEQEDRELQQKLDSAKENDPIADWMKMQIQVKKRLVTMGERLLLLEQRRDRASRFIIRSGYCLSLSTVMLCWRCWQPTVAAGNASVLLM
jgi:DNA repair exonuclease SbcCD ATPase subunit